MHLLFVCVPYMKAVCWLCFQLRNINQNEVVLLGSRCLQVWAAVALSSAEMSLSSAQSHNVLIYDCDLSICLSSDRHI